MKRIISLLISIYTCQFAKAQSNLVPKHYKLINEATGDLNKDGIAEKAFVYNMSQSPDDDEEGINRELIIYKKQKDKWIIWHRSTTAIGNSKSGGMMGDPFESIEINKGILLVYQSGGSSWKWNTTDKYRFQNNRFELIGYKSYYGKLCEYWLLFEYNISTQTVFCKKEYEVCDEKGDQLISKTEAEKFTYKLKQPITLQNRNKEEIKIESLKYKFELYL
ncbi:hypothetical protein IQ13_3653 [Lacibacter cauensis]|uniref:Uncharacterized protein n=1 Tax=Lacibacter cauensis TaxID=510947 RepID=A0A562SF21_9BACT|nr:hypothetical protein [Lacibacter cauensis]TWI79250.1 hypothetical protein IQ13_3653 [Lacibacter cauensis]